jgi:hypothetical protein
MENGKKNFQLVWGVALVLMGIGVFIRLPQVWPQIEKIEYFSSILPFIRFCFYLIGIMLIGGGSKKIYENYFKSRADDSESEE